MRTRSALYLVLLVITALVAIIVPACAATEHYAPSDTYDSAPRARYETRDFQYETAGGDAAEESGEAPKSEPVSVATGTSTAVVPGTVAPPLNVAPKETPPMAQPSVPQTTTPPPALKDEAAPPAEPPIVGREKSPELPEADKQGSEDYGDWGVNSFQDPTKDPLSTFAIDVDTASYTIARRKLNEGTLPPASAVRVEEFVNYFKPEYKAPDERSKVPFQVSFDAAPSPFRDNHVFMRVGVQGKRVSASERQPVHLTFLVDTSGSMQSADKMGLVKQSLHLLVKNLRKGDTVALATYAGAVREVLRPTSIDDADAIHAAIEDLTASGSTAMASGLELAYKLAYQNLKPGHVNRVIVCSDGDANVGAASHEQILDQIKHYTQEGVTLSTIGFGMGNYKDVMMEQLANKGNGNYYYIDSMDQATKVFQDDLMGTLVVIAKDVKIQVEFDPKAVVGYRLLGYENRDIADEDFRNDAVDAGEIGAGHSVTAVYELQLKRGAATPSTTVRIRHKEPEGSRASENTYRFDTEDMAKTFDAAPADFRFTVGVAAFAEILRHSPYAREWSLGQVRSIARGSADNSKDQQELVSLVESAIRLTDQPRASR